MDLAVREWAATLVRERPDVVGIGYFGSYARGDWGVGSDVDLVVVLTSAALPFERRAADLEGTKGVPSTAVGLPVPADLLVYTRDEWPHIAEQAWGRHLSREVVWVYGGGDDPARE